MRKTREPIRFRKNLNHWEGRIRAYDEAGRRLPSEWLSLGTDNRELAQRAYDEWFDTGESPPEPSQLTFAKAARDIAKAQRFDDDRVHRLEAYAIPLIGMNRIGRLEPHHVSAVLDAMAKAGHSRGYILKMRSDISQVFVHLMRDGHMKFNWARTMPISSKAVSDTRPRVRMSDEQVLLFFARRDMTGRLEMKVLFSRCIAGHRVSDTDEADWSHVDLVHFSSMRVRRPKTDGEVGEAVAGPHKPRAYDWVEHEVDDAYRGYIEAYWRAQGCPKKGPVFPMLRDGVTGMVRRRDGSLYERQGGKAGERRRTGSSEAAALRRAVWAAGIYDPTEDFDPEHPEKTHCRFQTDTPTSKRLDFQSFRRELVTAVNSEDSGITTQKALLITGHTQVNTQMKHYMQATRVRVPRGALPGGKAPAAPSGPSLAELQAAFAILQAGLGAAPNSAPSQGAAPSFGANESPSGARGTGKSRLSLASPRGIEPLTNALGKDSSAPKASDTHASAHQNDARETAEKQVLPQVLGQTESNVVPLTRARSRRR